MRNFGVIGNPIAHSLSPIIHRFLCSYFGISASYEKIHLLDAMDLRSRLLSLDGANITLPYKMDAFKVCDEVRGIAREIEAVNTILCEGDRLIGFNTDALGFWECIASLGVKNALILGAGGGARAVAVILQKKGIDVWIYNRTKEKLGFFKSKEIPIQDEIVLRDYDLVINATSAGLNAENLPIHPEVLQLLLHRTQYLFDLIYPSSEGVKTFEDFKAFLALRPLTSFLDFAKTKVGASGMDGLDMLLYQALFAFEIFCQRQEGFEELKALFYNQKN